MKSPSKSTLSARSTLSPFSTFKSKSAIQSKSSFPSKSSFVRPQQKQKPKPTYFIPFHALMSPTIFRATRFVTWRLDQRDYYPGRGDEFKIHVDCRALPYRFKCASIQKMPLEVCRKRYISDWQSMSFEGFEILWTRIHQRPYDGSLKVSVYTIDWLDPLPTGEVDESAFLPVV